MTEEHKRKISEALKGRKLSEDTKRKIGEGVKRYYRENGESDTENNRKKKLSERMKFKNELFEQWLLENGYKDSWIKPCRKD